MQKAHMIEAGTPQYVPKQRSHYSRLVKTVNDKSKKLEVRGWRFEGTTGKRQYLP